MIEDTATKSKPRLKVLRKSEEKTHGFSKRTYRK